jgi:hypothetical protein
VLSGDLKHLEVDLPRGLIGNATITPKCSIAEVLFASCPADTIVGSLEASVGAPEFLEGVGDLPSTTVTEYPPVPIFNVEPLEGEPAAFVSLPATFPLRSDTSVGPAGDYRVHATSEGLTELATIVSSKITFFGVPFDHTGAGARKPLMTNPTECSGNPLEANADAFSWEHPDVHVFASTTLRAITGCDKLRFQPSIVMQPSTSSAGTPSGYSVDVNVPQNEDASALGTPTLKDASVTFPEGVTLSPAVAHGLGSCSDAQFGLHSDAAVACPDSSQIGSIGLTTPLLEDKLEGSVFVGEPLPGNRYRVFFTIGEGKVLVKLEGKVTLDPSTGQVTATFLENPPLPFSNLRVELKGGANAALVNPTACGTKTGSASLTPSAGNAVTATASFQIAGNCSSAGFSPKLNAGVTSSAAGQPAPFVLQLTREDGEQNISRISATLPEGLLAKLAGVPLCPDVQAATGDCPSATQVGTTTVGVGAGSDPLYIPQAGKAPTAVYLAGPYKGAPYSLVVEVPAQAGPFDLGVVSVRTALQVDPTTTQVTAESDPLPQILEGVPVAYRDVRVEINRPDFTLNPTSCRPMSVASTIVSAQGATANPSNPFQVTSCGELDFAPTLALSLKGALKRTGNPALTAVLKAPPGQANIAKTQVILPRSEFIDNSHVNNPCTRVQFNAGDCPAKSILGTATAYSPLLEKPLTGPVYFRSNGGERTLPDLVADLNGQIHVVLVGFIDSVKSGKEGSRVRTRFLSVPDAPVSKFVLSLKGGNKGLIENSVNLCRSPQQASVQTEGQNGKDHDFTAPLGTSCGSKSKKK